MLGPNNVVQLVDFGLKLATQWGSGMCRKDIPTSLEMHQDFQKYKKATEELAFWSTKLATLAFQSTKERSEQFVLKTVLFKSMKARHSENR